jgi:DNA-binding MarR family transcriptional regulator
MSKTFTLQDFIPYRCVTLAERISNSLSRIYAEQFGVSVAEWRILTVLAEHDRLQASEVGAIVRMDKVKVSRAVSALVERRLLLRTPSKEDGRASDLRLSAAGKRLYQQIVPRALEWETSLVQPLSQEERRALFELFDKLESRVAALEADP